MRPDEFKVPDKLRQWCVEKGWPPTLPDIYLPRFLQWWKDVLEDGRKPKWKNPDLALRNWIRDSSPMSTQRHKYNPVDWERSLEAAKRLEAPARKPTPPAYHPREVKQAARTPTAHEHSRAALRKLRDLAKS